MEYSMESITAKRPAIAFGAGEYFNRYCESAVGIFDYFIDDALAGKTKNGVPIHPLSFLAQEKREVCIFIFQRSHALAVTLLRPFGFRWNENLFDARLFGDIGSGFSDFVILESLDEIRRSSEIEIYRSSGSHLDIDRIVIQKLPNGKLPQLHLAEGCELTARNLIISQNTKICGARNAKITIGSRVLLSPETMVSCGRSSILNIGDAVQFSPYTTLNAAGYTSLGIGADSSFGRNLDIYAYAPIEIGNDCMFSSQVFVASGAGHDLKIHEKLRPAEKICIGNHVWVGWGCRLLSGAAVGAEGMVAAGSIVNKFFGDQMLLAGVPSKVIHEGISWQRDFTAYKSAHYPKR